VGVASIGQDLLRGRGGNDEQAALRVTLCRSSRTSSRQSGSMCSRTSVHTTRSAGEASHRSRNAGVVVADRPSQLPARACVAAAVVEDVPRGEHLREARDRMGPALAGDAVVPASCIRRFCSAYSGVIFHPGNKLSHGTPGRAARRASGFASASTRYPACAPKDPQERLPIPFQLALPRR
jgi:hypothetical protein